MVNWLVFAGKLVSLHGQLVRFAGKLVSRKVAKLAESDAPVQQNVQFELSKVWGPGVLVLGFWGPGVLGSPCRNKSGKFGSKCRACEEKCTV